MCLTVNRVKVALLYNSHLFQRLNWHLLFSLVKLRNYCLSLLLMGVLNLRAFSFFFFFFLLKLPIIQLWWLKAQSDYEEKLPSCYPARSPGLSGTEILTGSRAGQLGSPDGLRSTVGTERVRMEAEARVATTTCLDPMKDDTDIANFLLFFLPKAILILTYSHHSSSFHPTQVSQVSCANTDVHGRGSRWGEGPLKHLP